MPRNGSGQYDLPYNWNDDKANNIKVLASRMQSQDQDIATALTGSLSKDGQTPLTGDLDFNSNKAIDLGNGTSAQDAAAISQVQSGGLQYYGVTSTTALGVDGENYDISLTPTIATYPAFARFSITCHYTSIAAPNARFDALAAKNLVKSNGASGYVALEAGDLIADKEYVGIYNEDISSSQIIIENPEIQIISSLNLNVSGDFSLSPQTSYIISSGEITITSSTILVDTESSAASDYLDSINGGSQGDLLIVSVADATHNVIITNAGNIITRDGVSATLSNLSDSITLMFNSSSSKWYEISRTIRSNYKAVPKAWVSFNGTSSSPITPSASYNITATVVKNSTGNYTVTFSTAFASANYSAILSAKATSGIAGTSREITKAAGSYRFLTTNTSGEALDVPAIDLVFFGEQV